MSSTTAWQPVERPFVAEVLYEYEPSGRFQIALAPGQLLRVAAARGGWYKGQREDGGDPPELGIFPVAYVKFRSYVGEPPPPPPAAAADEPPPPPPPATPGDFTPPGTPNVPLTAEELRRRTLKKPPPLKSSGSSSTLTAELDVMSPTALQKRSSSQTVRVLEGEELAEAMAAAPAAASGFGRDSEVRDEYGFQVDVDALPDEGEYEWIPRQRQRWAGFLDAEGRLPESAEWRDIYSRWRAYAADAEANQQPQGLVRRVARSLTHLTETHAKSFAGLVRGGVPPELRGYIWRECAGARAKREAAGAEEQYEELLQRAKLHPPAAAAEIEKDLPRTFPDNANFETEQGIDNMRRVLLAYSLRNPAVGYCQSMNFVCAVLLLHMDEDDAFWTLAAVVEDLVPDYYTKSMAGSHTDTRVFEDLLYLKLPKLHAHFQAVGMQLGPITFAWFLCLYVNTLPLVSTLRVWDTFFHEGAKALFRTGLAMLKLSERQLLAADGFADIYQLLRANDDVHPEQLLRKAHDKRWIGAFPHSLIDERRAEHRRVVDAEHAQLAMIKAEEAAAAAAAAAEEEAEAAEQAAAAAATDAAPVVSVEEPASPEERQDDGFVVVRAAARQSLAAPESETLDPRFSHRVRSMTCFLGDGSNVIDNYFTTSGMPVDPRVAAERAARPASQRPPQPVNRPLPRPPRASVADQTLPPMPELQAMAPDC